MTHTTAHRHLWGYSVTTIGTAAHRDSLAGSPPPPQHRRPPFVCSGECLVPATPVPPPPWSGAHPRTRSVLPHRPPTATARQTPARPLPAAPPDLTSPLAFPPPHGSRGAH